MQVLLPTPSEAPETGEYREAIREDLQATAMFFASKNREAGPRESCATAQDYSWPSPPDADARSSQHSFLKAFSGRIANTRSRGKFGVVVHQKHLPMSLRAVSKAFSRGIREE